MNVNQQNPIIYLYIYSEKKSAENKNFMNHLKSPIYI